MKFYQPGATLADPSAPDWQGIPSTLNQIYSPNGYMLFVRGDRSVTSAWADPNPTRMRTKGDLLTYTVSTPTAPLFTSIGNPYASQIDMRNVTKSGGANEFFYLWNSDSYGQYGYGSYITYNLIGTEYVGTPGGQTRNNVESGQAFLVQSTSAGALTFNETSKTSTYGYDNSIFRQQNISTKVQLLRTDLYGVNKDGSKYLTDGTLVQFGDKFSNKVDGLDARKIFNSGINLAIQTDGKSLAVERRLLPSQQDTIFMNLTAAPAQNYNFVFDAKGLATEGLEAFLEDRYLKTLTPLSMSDSTVINFSIENTPGSKAKDRFDIVFKRTVELPVSLTDLIATPQGRDIEIGWKVANEKNINSYELEKSFDGVQFVKLAALSALNQPLSSYNYDDKDLLPGYYYYRVKFTDKSGKVQYSNIVKALIGNGKPQLSIYPNPITNGIIHLQFINLPAGKYGIRLMNQLGQVIVSKQVERMNGSNTEMIKWDYNLAHGVYQLEITQPDGSIKIIKVLY